MRVAVVGAGIIGVTCAYELAEDGHDVTVFERRPTVAAEASFANAGVIAPGYVTPWAAPGMPGKVLRHLFARHAPVRIGGWPSASMLRWSWLWWRACRPAAYAANRASMHRLALYSRERLHAIAERLQLDYERRDGLLVLLRTPRDVALARPGLKLLAEIGVPFRLIDANRCREIEPALNAETPLQAGIHLAHEEVGNCRQFAQLMKGEAQQRGVAFVFNRDVVALAAGAKPQLVHRPAANGSAPEAQSFDAVVVCAALGAKALLAPLGLKLPLEAVHGYSITAPLRDAGPHPDPGPRAAVMDERYKVAISRLGGRVRVAGSAELGGSVQQHNEPALQTLYKVLDDWFPGAARPAQAQPWKGARPMLPDGPPLLGASGLAGIWLDVGHGSSGWALACGSARVVADLIGGRAPALDASRFAVQRLR
jgi:D-amino-acid dehydrogenase